MREIDSSSTAPAAARRRPLRRFALTTVAAAVAAALVTVLVVDGHPAGGNPVGAPRPTSSAAPNGPTDSHTQAVELLDQAATVAATQDLPTVRHNQFVYTDIIRSVYDPQIPARMGKPHREQWWVSVDGLHAGLEIAFGERKTLQPLFPSSFHHKPSFFGDFHRPTYAFLATLPTDPKALLAQIYAQPTGAMSRDLAAVSDITFMLLEGAPPPKLAAALYRAAAMIPGISVEPAHVDQATGRHVVSLFWLSADGVRTSWLFDSGSKTFLGYEMVQGPSAHPVMKQGFVFEYQALVHGGIVDRPGQLP